MLREDPERYRANRVAEIEQEEKLAQLVEEKPDGQFLFDQRNDLFT